MTANEVAGFFGMVVLGMVALFLLVGMLYDLLKPDLTVSWLRLITFGILIGAAATGSWYLWNTFVR
jgi:hypothetical protein